MYWSWKNSNAEYIGLSHYRRHFSCKHYFIGTIRKKRKSILSKEKAKQLLQEYDAILPKKRHYWIETNFSHYAHAHNGEDLIQTRKVIMNMYPEYAASFDKVMKRRSAHMFNMLIMKREIFDAYSEWLFNILFQVEKEIDISKYDPYEARVFGYISELLLDVWLDVNQINYIELPVMFMEKQNWFKKIFNFLKRKYTAKSKQLTLDKVN